MFPNEIPQNWASRCPPTELGCFGTLKYGSLLSMKSFIVWGVGGLILLKSNPK